MLPFYGFGGPLLGSTGAKGDKGDKGDQGDKGDTGDQGPPTTNYVTDNTDQTITGIKTFTDHVSVTGTSSGTSTVWAGTTDLLTNTYGGFLTSVKMTLPTHANTLTFPDDTGTVALTSNIPSVSGFVTGPGSAVNGNLASFNGTTGKIIQDASIISTDVLTTTNTKTLTSKTIADTGNTITVGGTNISSLLNQDVRTTASPTFVGTFLQTSGGTATTLNYYEEASGTMTWGTTFYAAAQSSSYKFTRVGNVVTFYCAGVSAALSNGGVYLTSSTIPARFRPNNDVDYTKFYKEILVINNSAGDNGWLLYDDNTHVFYITPSASFAAGPSLGGWSGTCGFKNIMISYLIIN